MKTVNELVQQRYPGGYSAFEGSKMLIASRRYAAVASDLSGGFVGTVTVFSDESAPKDVIPLCKVTKISGQFTVKTNMEDKDTTSCLGALIAFGVEGTYYVWNQNQSNGESIGMAVYTSMFLAPNFIYSGGFDIEGAPISMSKSVIIAKGKLARQSKTPIFILAKDIKASPLKMVEAKIEHNIMMHTSPLAALVLAEKPSGKKNKVEADDEGNYKPKPVQVNPQMTNIFGFVTGKM